MLVAMATLASAMALLSGIFAVGNGAAFDYETKEIAKGRKDAVLYVWVTISSIFSLAHFACLMDYGIKMHWSYLYEDTPKWMCIHTGVAFLLTSAHFYIRSELQDPANRFAYLWGKGVQNAS